MRLAVQTLHHVLISPKDGIGAVISLAGGALQGMQPGDRTAGQLLAQNPIALYGTDVDSIDKIFVQGVHDAEHIIKTALRIGFPGGDVVVGFAVTGFEEYFFFGQHAAAGEGFLLKGGDERGILFPGLYDPAGIILPVQERKVEILRKGSAVEQSVNITQHAVLASGKEIDADFVAGSAIVLIAVQQVQGNAGEVAFLMELP